MKKLTALICCSVFLLSAGVIAKDVKQISWETLNEHVVKKEIANPFEDMDIEQIRKMQQIAIIEDIAASGQEVDETTKKLGEQAHQELTEQGIDVEALFVARTKIINQREQEFASTNPALNNADIEMQGFLLPLEFEGKKVKQFLLVPYVGACIHEPPPAPNQIVFATLKEAVEPPQLGMFTAIKVKGVIKSERVEPELNLVDGAKPIPTSYSLAVDEIEFMQQQF